FNRDVPYDQFIRLQLAADRLIKASPTGGAESTDSTCSGVPATGSPDSGKEGHALPVQPVTATSDLAALGFLGLGPKYYDRGKLDVMSDEWEDRVDTVSRTFLGLTVSFARCHDHKFDPITYRDYYALAGVFASTKMVNRMPDGKPEEKDVKAQKMN